MTEIYVNTKKAAEILEVSPLTLRNWRVSGNGPRYRKFGRLVRYARTDLEKWADKDTRESTSDGS
jgi:hypothetical protein